MALFGSYVRGTAREDSDIDVLIDYFRDEVLQEAESVYEA